MKRFYFLFLLFFGISNYSFGKVKFQKAVGLLSDSLLCAYHIESSGDVFCNKKKGANHKFPLNGVGDIRKAVIKRITPGGEQMVVYEVKDGYYKLGYIWDSINKKSVVFDLNIESTFDVLSLPLYKKALLKETYEVRYFWFKPTNPYRDSNSINYYVSLDKGIKSFNLTSDHDINLFTYPDGKVIDLISGDKIKDYKINFSHAKGKGLGTDSTEAHMVMYARVLDTKYVKSELWFKIKIPLTQTYDELDLVSVKNHGLVPTPITFKQSIFDKEKIGWIKVFDKDGFFVFR